MGVASDEDMITITKGTLLNNPTKKGEKLTIAYHGDRNVSRYVLLSRFFLALFSFDKIPLFFFFTT